MNRWKQYQQQIFKIPRKTEAMRVFPDITPLIDVVFLLIIFFMLSSSFVRPAGIKVSLPKAVTAEVLQNEKFVITITAENIIYFKEKAITLMELKELLSSNKGKIKSILIKADNMASLGRVIAIWDICRELGFNQVNIATLEKR